MNKTLIAAIALIIFALTIASCDFTDRFTAPAKSYDILVYGGTSAGVTAAVQAARMGKSVILIEPSSHLGGLSAGGLGATDIGNKAAIGGLSREFYTRIHAHYHPDDPPAAQWTFEPHVAEKVFNDMLNQARVPVVYNQRLNLKDGVVKIRGRIVYIKTESNKKYKAKMFIDATYEGDSLALAGVSYTVGREANATYSETLNGVQTKNAIHHQFIKPVDPYVTPGDPASGLLPGVHDEGPGAEGAADRRVQAYCFRLCATNVPENRRPWPKPQNYNPLRYELLLRNFEAGDHRIPWNPVMMPNGKTDSNNNFAISTDNIGFNYDYPDGDYKTRAAIIAEHENYQKGLMWTLANSPRVPDKVRAHFNEWGLSKDEFTDNDNWPHQLYIREARRMVADYVMTEHNCRGSVTCDDPVGLAAYTMDSHNVQRYVDTEGFARNEGDVQIGGFPPYPISYRSIIPKQSQCSNLAVPVCLSASHIAYGSIRMEPVFMLLGQSAATAASHALDEQTSLQNINYEKLKACLLADKQILSWNK
jgi:hypothetical protein